jgi:hypothetical protein
MTPQVGVFRQCNTFFGGADPEAENCFDVGLNDANINEWCDHIGHGLEIVDACTMQR